MIQTFEVLNVKCQGCANTLTKALSENGYNVQSVDLSVVPRKVTVEIDDNFDKVKFMALLRGLGYPLSEDELSSLQSISAKAKSFVSCAIGKVS